MKGVIIFLLLVALVNISAMEGKPITASSPCDTTLSFVERYDTLPGHPEFGGTGFIYQQLSCEIYNRTIFFYQPNQPDRYSTSTLIHVQLPHTKESFVGVAWQENIRMELQVDPLSFSKERWLWSSNGKTLIYDFIEDHIRKGRDGSDTYSWTASTSLWNSTFSSGDEVLKVYTVFSRKYVENFQNDNQPVDLQNTNQKYIWKKIK